jgi:tetraacyldisaccharide 4'-kinase
MRKTILKLYHQLMKLRVKLYRQGLLKRHTLPGKTISVGNIAPGGTGKTPVTVALARYLKEHGYKPAVLTRGYRSGLAPNDNLVYSGTKTLLPPRQTAVVYADEAKMMAVTLEDVPVIVGAKRYEAAQRYLQTGARPTHWILDDGFQHLRLERDLDIALVGSDTLRPGAEWLREHPYALRRADVVLITRADKEKAKPLTSFLKGLGKNPILVPFRQDPFMQVSGVTKEISSCKSIGLATAIARPKRLIDFLADQKLTVHKKLVKRDHDRFKIKEIFSLKEECDGILTTAKDYWRDPAAFEVGACPVFVTSVSAQFEDSILEEILGPVLKPKT